MVRISILIVPAMLVMVMASFLPEGGTGNRRIQRRLVQSEYRAESGICCQNGEVR